MQEFSKDAAERFLPDFAEPVIWALHSNVFPAVPVALVEELFSKWGGIPRMVLRRAKTHSTSDLDKLNAAITSSLKEGLLSACRNEDTQQVSFLTLSSLASPLSKCFEVKLSFLNLVLMTHQSLSMFSKAYSPQL